MKINSNIIKSVYRISLEESLFDPSSKFYQRLKASYQKIEDQHQIESLIPVEEAISLIQYFTAKEGMHKLGYNIGRKMRLHDLGTFGYFLMSCSHMYFVRMKLDQYQFLVSDVFNFNFKFNEHYMTWNLTTPILDQIPNSKTLHFISDFEIAFRHSVVTELLQKNIHPTEINVVYTSTEEHKKFLERQYNCTVIFDAENNSIKYKLGDVNQYIPSKNYYVYHSLEPKLLELLKKWNQNSGNYSLKVKRLILSNLNHFQFSFDYTASKLNMSVRNLQRQLKMENNSYNNLLETARKEMVVIYLKKGLKNKEIARRLGYTETNSFVRSFKKWYGMNVGEYKKTML